MNRIKNVVWCTVAVLVAWTVVAACYRFAFIKATKWRVEWERWFEAYWVTGLWFLAIGALVAMVVCLGYFIDAVVHNVFKKGDG